MSFQVGELVAPISADSTSFNRSLDKARARGEQTATHIQRRFQQLGTSMRLVGKQMSLFVTLPLIGIAAASAKMSIDMNRSMANIASLIPNSIGRVKELKTGVQDLAIDLGKSTDDLAGGLYNVISAVGDSSESLKLLRINAKAAAGGLATTR